MRKAVLVAALTAAVVLPADAGVFRGLLVDPAALHGPPRRSGGKPVSIAPPARRRHGPRVWGALRADQDPGHTRTSRLQLGRIVAVSAVQGPCEACTTSRRRTCWHSAQVAEWDRSAPRSSQHPAAPVQSGGHPTSGAMRLMTHQNERHMSVKMPLRASFQRQDIAHNAHSAHNAHHPNLQVRRPLRPVQGWQRTPRGASSETGRWPSPTCIDVWTEPRRQRRAGMTVEP